MLGAWGPSGAIQVSDKEIVWTRVAVAAVIWADKGDLFATRSVPRSHTAPHRCLFPGCHVDLSQLAAEPPGVLALLRGGRVERVVDDCGPVRRPGRIFCV